MRALKALNGLPNDLVQMYFSTDAYYRTGYMADHLLSVAMSSGLRVADIDILQGTITPVEFATPAILSYLPTLRQHVLSTIDQLLLPSDHVIEAHIDVTISGQEEEMPFLSGTGWMRTTDGRIRKGHVYSKDGIVIK